MLHELSIRNKLIVMSAVMSALFLVALDQTIVSTALAAIVKEFNSFSSLGFIVTAYMLTTTVTVPLAGKLSDMYGRKPLLLAGVSIFTIGSLLSGLAVSSLQTPLPLSATSFRQRNVVNGKDCLVRSLG